MFYIPLFSSITVFDSFFSSPSNWFTVSSFHIYVTFTSLYNITNDECTVSSYPAACFQFETYEHSGLSFTDDDSLYEDIICLETECTRLCVDGGVCNGTNDECVCVKQFPHMVCDTGKSDCLTNICVGNDTCVVHNTYRKTQVGACNPLQVYQTVKHPPHPQWSKPGDFKINTWILVPDIPGDIFINLQLKRSILTNYLC